MVLNLENVGPSRGRLRLGIIHLQVNEQVTQH
jgi:hypothetical protein